MNILFQLQLGFLQLSRPACTVYMLGLRDWFWPTYAISDPVVIGPGRGHLVRALDMSIHGSSSVH